MTRSLVPTVCPYCAVGCGLYIVVDDGKAVGIEYMQDHPASEGSLCPKGNAALEMLYHPDRLTHPLKRAGEMWLSISWPEALDLVAGGLSKALREGGPAGLGFIASSKCTNEESYLLQKMVRSLGCANIDSCARLCHSSSVTGLGRALGTCSTTNILSDLANSRCILAIGTNFAENHPIVARWVFRAREAGGRLIVADPRRTPTAWGGDLFLQLNPGTDVALINGMIKVILDEGLINRRFIEDRTEGFSDLESSLEGFSLSEAERITGVSASDIVGAARAYARSPASAIVYCMGVTQHANGTDNVQALANLLLICGQIGRSGAGIYPLRGQNNVQGTCDMGCLPDFYPGYLSFEDPRTQEAFRRAWGSNRLPAKKGLTSLEMMDAAAANGTIKAMYIVGEDAANTHPCSKRTAKALGRLEFLVVQDIFLTETARFADVVLPAACWAEKEGSSTSTERRIQWHEKAVEPPGDAMADLWIICNLARRLGLNFHYRSSKEVMDEICDLVPIYRGAKPSASGGVLWPCKKEGEISILHEETFPLARGRAIIRSVHFRRTAEETSSRYPFLLTIGRIGAHHNAGSMTMRSPSLLGMAPHRFVEINPKDALSLGLDDGADVVVETARGEARAKTRSTDRVMPGTLFMPFHFPGANHLVRGYRDEHSGMGELKIAACRIERC